MFSGIIQAKTPIKSHRQIDGSLILIIVKPKNWKIKAGDSIATNGVCLTVKKVLARTYETELMPETLAKTTFGKKLPGQVNLEPSLKLGDKIMGHLVLGHVDTIGKIVAIGQHGQTKDFKIKVPKTYADYLATKGSITVDGIGLTIVKGGADWFTFSAVSYTLQNTSLGDKQVGDLVNVEFDVMAKYLKKLIEK